MNRTLSRKALRDDCQDEGLDCRSCIECAAKDLATVCQQLDGKAAEAIFLRLHTRRACRTMAAEFRACFAKQAELVRLETVQEFVMSRMAQCA